MGLVTVCSCMCLFIGIHTMKLEEKVEDLTLIDKLQTYKIDLQERRIGELEKQILKKTEVAKEKKVEDLVTLIDKLQTKIDLNERRIGELEKQNLKKTEVAKNESLEGWIDLRKRGLLIAMQINTAGLNWQDSVTSCREKGGRLMVLKNVQIRRAVVAEFMALGACSYNNFWFGLSDLEVEDTWVWLDGSSGQDRPNFIIFVDGQPHNNNGLEHCGVANPQYGLLFTSYTCSYTQPYICEKALAGSL